MNIFVPFKDGDTLENDVMRGIISQNIYCKIIPISSKGNKAYSEKNRNNNLLRALKVNKEDSIIIMDSDVVMNFPEAIKQLTDDFSNSQRDIVTFTTKKEKVSNCPYVPHALMYIKGKTLKDFEKYLKNYKAKTDGKEACAICRFIHLNIHKCCTLENSNIYELQRL